MRKYKVVLEKEAREELQSIIQKNKDDYMGRKDAYSYLWKPKRTYCPRSERALH